MIRVFGRVAGGHRALALRVEPALRSPSAKPTNDPIARGPGEGLKAIPSKARTARSAVRKTNTCFPPAAARASADLVAAASSSHGALAARRPLPVSDRAQHRSPDFFAFWGTVPGFQTEERGVHKAASGFTKLPLSSV